MKKEEQFDKLFEALKGLDYGTWFLLKKAIDAHFKFSEFMRAYHERKEINNAGV